MEVVKSSSVFGVHGNLGEDIDIEQVTTIGSGGG